MKQPIPRSRSSRSGFTLVEVLVSSLLTLMVMGMLFTVLIGTIDAWEGGTTKLETSGNARQALDILKSDLEGLVARQTQYNQEWIYSGPFPDGRSGIRNTVLTFFSPSLDRASGQQGDIVGVSYMVYYQDPISEAEIAPIYGLYKGMTTTEQAFNDALGYPPNSLLVRDGISNADGFWWQGNPIPLMYEKSGLLAPHVVRFSVTWLVRQAGASSLTRVDETNYVRLNNQLQVFSGNQAGVTGKIEAAEISITTLNEEAMTRFRFFEGNGNQAGQLTNLIDEFGTSHTIRVPITY